MQRPALLPTATLALLLLLHGAPAEAQGDEEEEEEGYGRRGMYLVAFGSYALDDFKSPHTVRGTWGAGARLGYRLHPRLAGEAQVEWLDRFRERAGGVTIRTFKDSYVASANLKGYFLTDWYQPYASVGVGAFRLNENVTATSARDESLGVAVRLGLGVDLYGDESMALNVGFDYVLAEGDVDDADYFSFGSGLMLRF
jgi:hypothetical protein